MFSHKCKVSFTHLTNIYYVHHEQGSTWAKDSASWDPVLKRGSNPVREGYVSKQLQYKDERCRHRRPRRRRGAPSYETGVQVQEHFSSGDDLQGVLKDEAATWSYSWMSTMFLWEAVKSANDQRKEHKTLVLGTHWRSSV